MFLCASYSSSHLDISRTLAGSQASQNDRESFVLLKLLNAISVAPNILVKCSALRASGSEPTGRDVGIE